MLGLTNCFFPVCSLGVLSTALLPIPSYSFEKSQSGGFFGREKAGVGVSAEPSRHLPDARVEIAMLGAKSRVVTSVRPSVGGGQPPGLPDFAREVLGSARMR